MSCWARIRAANRCFDEWLDRNLQPGGFFDLRSYKGCIRWFLFFAAVTYVLWHFDDFYAWQRHILGIPYEIDRAKQSWAQLWAWIIGGSGMATAVLGMIMIPINRYRARKSAEGQWYDHPDVTRKTLYGEDEEDDDRDDTPARRG